MPEVHARLSASGAKRWMNCPPSVALEEQFPDKGSEYAREGSEYAREGTLAHSLAEAMIRYNAGQIKKAEFNRILKGIQKDELYSIDMLDYVEDYASIVWEDYNAAKKEDSLILVEQRVDFSDYVPDGFGTCDAVIITDGKLHIYDLKYGKGVEVFAQDNPQLRLYGLGAVEAFDLLYDFDTVEMTIIQPRLGNVSTETMTVEELRDWGRLTVRPLAEKATRGEGEFKPGDHCQFCKARATCRARAEANMELAKMEFADPALLDDSEIGEVLRVADQLQKWVKDVADYALAEAVNHRKKWDGWKLVEGRSNRKYVDETKVVDALHDAGYADAVIYKKELWGITAMEKLIGKKNFSDFLGNLVEKPAGKPVLVPESDKRPELNAIEKAKEDFKDD